MAFFDDVGKKITKTSQGVAQKTKNVAETVRINGLISDEEKRVNGAYTQIGKMYYDRYGANPDPYFVQLITEISDSKAKIAGYTEQVKQLKGVVRCPNCGSDVQYGAAFCSVCGASMAAAPAADTASVCPRCGAAVTPDKLFCTNCGFKLNQPAAPAPVEPVVEPAPVVTPEPVVAAPVVAPAPEPAEVKCASCGAVLPPDSVFCLNCGQKIGG